MSILAPQLRDLLSFAYPGSLSPRSTWRWRGSNGRSRRQWRRRRLNAL